MNEVSARKKILLIDDDPLSQKLLAMALKLHGYAPTLAANGNEAKAILEKETTDVIVLDLMMPEMDGARFLRWLRTEALLTIPVIILSAAATPPVHKDMLEIGANDVIRKPLSLPTLLTALRGLGV